MRPSSLLVFLLVLHLMLCGAYGARLGKFDTKSTDASDQLTNVEIEYTVEKLDHQKNDNLHKREIIIEVKCEDDESHCSTKGTLKRRVMSTRVASSDYHHHPHHHQHHHHHHHHHHDQWVPWIFEDYRGPYRHRPRHH